MTQEATAEPQRRGRPRSEKAREAILAAAVELLLARGLGAVSMDAVDERAGVSKATIYPLVADQGNARPRRALSRVGCGFFAGARHGLAALNGDSWHDPIDAHMGPLTADELSGQAPSLEEGTFNDDVGGAP